MSIAAATHTEIRTATSAPAPLHRVVRLAKRQAERAFAALGTYGVALLALYPILGFLAVTAGLLAFGQSHGHL